MTWARMTLQKAERYEAGWSVTMRLHFADWKGRREGETLTSQLQWEAGSGHHRTGRRLACADDGKRAPRKGWHCRGSGHDGASNHAELTTVALTELSRGEWEFSGLECRPCP